MVKTLIENFSKVYPTHLTMQKFDKKLKVLLIDTVQEQVTINMPPIFMVETQSEVVFHRFYWRSQDVIFHYVKTQLIWLSYKTLKMRMVSIGQTP